MGENEQMYKLIVYFKGMESGLVSEKRLNNYIFTVLRASYTVDSQKNN